MLVGGVLSVLWALLYRAFALTQGVIAWVQTVLYQIGALIMVAALYMLYGPMAGDPALGPVLGVSSILVIAGTVLMLLQSLRFKSTP